MELHKAVLRKDLHAVRSTIARWEAVDEQKDADVVQHPINGLDWRGNSALHLACLLGWAEGVRELVESGADSRRRNHFSRWTCLQECITTSNRPLTRLLLDKTHRQLELAMERQTQRLVKHLPQIPDFHLNIHWKFSSWVPFVGRLCPSDTMQVWKQGSRLRVDMSLVDFGGPGKWKRGHVSILFTEIEGALELVSVDHVSEDYKLERCLPRDGEPDFEEQLEFMLQNNVMHFGLDSSDVKLNPRKSWLGYIKRDTVADMDCVLFDVTGVKVAARTRSEHIPAWLVKEREKSAKEYEERLRSGDGHQEQEGLGDLVSVRRVQLPEYHPPDVCADAYFDQSRRVQLGRRRQESRHEKTLNAKLWLSSDFGLRVPDILPILEAVASSNTHVKKLMRFLTLRMDEPGFPVKMEIPLYHVVTGTAEFTACDFQPHFSTDHFDVPSSYRKVLCRDHLASQSHS